MQRTGNRSSQTGSIDYEVENMTSANLNRLGQNANMQQMSKGTEQSMTEKDILADCLRGEILLAQSYNSACIESADQNVYQNLKNILNEVHDIHYEVFNTMSQKGWYPVSQANPQDINNTRNMYQS